MQFEEMGNRNGKTLMLLPGTGCTWQINFKNVIEDLGSICAGRCCGIAGKPIGMRLMK